MLGGAAVWGVQSLKQHAVARAAVKTQATGRRETPVLTDPSIGNLPESFTAIGFETWLGLPLMFWMTATLAIAVHILLSRTLLGRRLCGVG